MPKEVGEAFTDEQEKVTKAVETWLESTTGSSEVAPSKVGRDSSRLLSSPESEAPSKPVISNQQIWVEDQLTRHEGAGDAVSRAAPTEGGTDKSGDDDGAGSVIFNMISKSPRVVKRSAGS
ncbi:hypothetical protein Sste5344_000261 [Sporothrix stenoceras]